MRAIVCESFDSPSALTVTEIDKPEPTPGQVVIKIEATGLGYVDALTVAGLYQIKPRLPFIPGNEISGVIDQAGENVKHLRKGQRVLASISSGGLAEYIAIDENRCTGIPESFGFDAAASFLVNYCTAYHGFSYCGKLKEKETVLILGGSGGVGVAAIDIARSMGATVIAAASTAEKREACIAAGAHHALDYTGDDWRGELKTMLQGQKLDVVYDPVGGDYAEPALRSLGSDGRYLVVGFASGDIPKFPVNLALLKRCSIVGVNWGGHVAEHPSASREALTTLLEWITEGKIKPQSGEAFGLADTGSAMMKMLNREAIGKIVIHPSA